ncbi:MAG: hypothetical protein FWE71_14085 [Nocardioidaceae bacterium]|nr:hypothetical protein [Nocardioidaceae bacterium]MCL2611736.1 hypothetical protein [Nocardioidaceae bacterium]
MPRASCLDGEDPAAGREEWRRASDAVQELRHTVNTLPRETDDRTLDAAAVVVCLERAVSLWT